MLSGVWEIPKPRIELKIAVNSTALRVVRDAKLSNILPTHSCCGEIPFEIRSQQETTELHWMVSTAFLFTGNPSCLLEMRGALLASYGVACQRMP